MEQNQRNIMAIRMFGGFWIRWGEYEITSSVRTKKLWMLIEFLILHRGQAVTQDQLYLALWNQEECDNPSSALKNLVYRARNFLQKEFHTNEELIVFRDGGYWWNPDIPCLVDCEEMKRLLEAAQSAPYDERTINLQQAFALYKGIFLPRMEFADWVQRYRIRYQKMYESCVAQLSDFLLREKHIEKLIGFIKKAIEIDPESEDFRRILLQAYLEAGYYQKGLEYYQSITNKQNSTKLHELYERLIQNVNTVDFDLSAIKDELRKAENEVGAFFCDYNVFKNIYQIQARSLLREGRFLYVGLLVLSGISGGEIEPAIKSQVIEAVKETLVVGLRRGDVVSQYAENQFVMLLPLTDLQAGQIVTERLEKNYQLHYPELAVNWNIRFSQIEPIE